MEMEITTYKSGFFGLERWVFCTLPPPLLMRQDFLVGEGFEQLHVFFSSKLTQREELPETHRQLLRLPRTLWARGQEETLIVIGSLTGDPLAWSGPTLVANFADETILIKFYEKLARHLPVATGFTNAESE